MVQEQTRVNYLAPSIGTTVAPFFVTGIVFGGLAMEDVQVGQLQMPFIYLMLVIAVVTFILSRMSLPDIQGTRVEKGEKLEKRVWSFSHLTLGVIAVFFYVGVEVCVGANINLYTNELVEAGIGSYMPALMATLYWGAIFTLSVNRLGKYTSVASGVFMIGVLGKGEAVFGIRISIEAKGPRR